MSSGAAPEAATSPHATEAVKGPLAKLFADVTIEQIRMAAQNRDWGACRDAAQKMRRAGADMPAPLMALAALDPAARDRAQK